MSEWTITVSGVPRPKGSWKARGRWKARPLIRNGEAYWRIRDIVLEPQNVEGLSAWTAALQWAAKAADPPRHPIDGPWYCACTFFFQPPKSRAGGTWAIGQKLEPNGRCTNTGDQDKLLRAVLDAFTGIFWTDDRHVCDGAGPTKIYCSNRPPGALIVVRYLGDEQLCLV